MCAVRLKPNPYPNPWLDSRMEPIVDLEHVRHRFGSITALRDVSFSIETGEIFGLIGPNGAGKTTLVRAICGILEPDHGSIAVMGSSPALIPAGTIGFLPQAFAPPGRLTGRELIDYYARLFPDTRSVDDVLADVGMSDAADQWYEQLSGGQQRRICVGTAIVHDPPLLILDEPTTGIDPAGRRRLWSLLAELRDAGRTILVTTHDMTEAATLSDRVALIADGRIVALDCPDALIDAHAEAPSVRFELREPLAAGVRERIPVPIVVTDEGYELTDVEPDQLADVISTLVAEDISFRRITWAEPGLENVYHQLMAAEDQ